ncbi:MAG: enoyl-CoA hydratase/isomerase family protein [Alphaproteobacteria bacterium]
MTYETLLYAVNDRVALITLNRPERMNAFSLKLMQEIKAAVGEADRDAAVRVIVITGAGGKAFSAGYDLKESAEAPKKSTAEWTARFRGDLDFTYSVWNCSKPVIAMISGYCLAGALEFAQCCDLRYCSSDSTFGAVEARFAGAIVTMIMPWIIGNRARELIYTGDTIGAEEAHRIGLVDRVFAKDALEAETMKIAKRMSRVALGSLQTSKRALNHTFETMGLHSALAYGAEAASLMRAAGSPEGDTFEQIRRTKGLKDALRWRAEQFAPFE